MKSLIRLSKKKSKLVIGLMSGTSADGIDAVLVEIKNKGVKTKLRQIAFEAYPYSKSLKKFILKNSDVKTARLDDITRLNILLGEYFADAAVKIIQKAQSTFGKQHIDLIGTHGQTISHLPGKINMFGKSIRATLQIGDPTVIAKRTGIVTVGDFRVADVAVGGSGAPLVPYFDYIMFRSDKHNRGLLNIGGIANITVIPKNASLNAVFAFDTGPGNMIIDNLMKRLFNKPFDKSGQIACRGKLNIDLLSWMMKSKYLSQQPPKSTGREMFGDKFVENILKKTKTISGQDIITTITEFTAITIYDAYLKFIKNKVKLDEIIVSGGGVHNLYLMNSLKMYFHPIIVKPIEDVGYSSDAKEAICFAVLANETISGIPANIIKSTGALKTTILGKICLP
ncbi:MAG: anhydro-N-acetylmuramic acid kinase [Bacteroidota bacterium]|nr:anhydro-N-acetylmuramic acid kinase [Bacteroidota bacterium]